MQIFLGVAGNCDSPGSSTDGWAVTLEVSRNSGAAWSTACFPSFEAEHGYTLYDMGGDAFVHVDHSDTRDPVKAGQPLGVLYHADADGKLFSLSRRDVLLQPTGVSDFMPAGGLSGVALANSVDPAVWTDPAFLTGSTTVYSAVLSSVSRDAGSNWAPLPTPAPLAGQPACGGDATACALHVHGPDAAWRANISYPGLYASAGTPGLLWSTGSVGHHLSYEPADVRTFLSLDGGSSWTTVAPNAHTYEQAAYGSLLVMAAAGPSGATTEVHYSVDGGLCWGAVQLAQPMEVHNIQTRPDNGGQLLVCHGLLPHQRLGVYVLDFRALLSRANVPTCGASDFEAWAPAGCQRGSSLILTRRKAHARCLPAFDWVPPPPMSRPCGCSAADYECSYGYERDASGGCVKMQDFSIDPGCPDAPAASTRLIAGDACTNPPPHSGGGGGSGRSRKRGPSGFVVFLIVVVVLAFVGAVALCVARFLGLPLPPALRDGVDDAWSAVSNSYARLKGARGRPLATEEEAWLNGPASFAPLAGSYEPPRS